MGDSNLNSLGGLWGGRGHAMASYLPHQESNPQPCSRSMELNHWTARGSPCKLQSGKIRVSEKEKDSRAHLATVYHTLAITEKFYTF